MGERVFSYLDKKFVADIQRLVRYRDEEVKIVLELGEFSSPLRSQNRFGILFFGLFGRISPATAGGSVH